MTKTQEKLNTIKEEVETLNKKPVVLNEEKLVQVSGGQMSINHSLQAHNTSNQTNNHADAIAEISKRISTGQEINHTKDNPISNAISDHLAELNQHLEE